MNVHGMILLIAILPFQPSSRKQKPGSYKPAGLSNCNSGPCIIVQITTTIHWRSHGSLTWRNKMDVSHIIDAKTFHGVSLDPATRSEMATLAGRVWWFALGMLFDSV